MKFPVFSLHNREFGSETGSLETASSSGESMLGRARECSMPGTAVKLMRKLMRPAVA